MTSMLCTSGGGGRCSICSKYYVANTIPTNSKPPPCLPQLCTLVEFSLDFCCLCDLCHPEVTRLLDIIKELEKLQMQLKRGVNSLKRKKQEEVVGKFNS